MPSADAQAAAALVQWLVEQGVSQRTIGQAIGRNDSLISQIRRGTGKGGSLRGDLQRVRDAAERLLAGGQKVTPESLRTEGVAEPPRRQTSSGRVARVRRAVSKRGNGWSTSNVKQQAARHGAGGMVPELEDAARDGRNVAFDLTFALGKNVRVLEGSGRAARNVRKAGGHKIHAQSVTMGDGGELGAAGVLARYRAGSVSFARMLCDMAEERGLITFEGDPLDALVAIEMRTF